MSLTDFSQPARQMLTLQTLSRTDLLQIVERSHDFSQGQIEKTLEGKIVGIYFRRSSTRTRTAFTAGALRLGAQTISFGPKDLQTSTGETEEDTGRVLSGFLDALVIRTNDPQAEMEALARHSKIPIINAMSAEEHPTQALADLSTIREHFGRIEGIHLVYLGEGNNTTSALVRAFAKLRGNRLTLLCPEGYGLDEDFLDGIRPEAKAHGTEISQHHRMDDFPAEADVVYTTRWQTMGVPKPDPDWKNRFRPFTVTTDLMQRLSGTRRAIFMHDLPAVRGDDVVDEVLDGPDSLAWRQAEHKMFSAMATLEWCLA